PAAPAFVLSPIGTDLSTNGFRRGWCGKEVDRSRLQMRNDFVFTLCPLRGPHHQLRRACGKPARLFDPIQKLTMLQTLLYRLELAADLDDVSTHVVETSANSLRHTLKLFGQ